MTLKKEARLQMERSQKTYSRTYADSPVFYINAGTFAVSVKKTFTIQEDLPTALKYAPITNVQIINGSAVDIIFFPNQRSSGFIVATGTSVVFDRKTLGGGIYSFRLENSSATGAIADKEVELNLWREGIVFDQAFQKMHEAFFKFLFRR